MRLLDQIKANTGPGPYFEDDDGEIPILTAPAVRLIAYYLPQFHPIPENDKWWGKGFTEWTNVTKAIPRYSGHLQPRLPGALGFYDLRMVESLRQQASLAKRHGINGFCFHYYWFAGKKLLETPLEMLLKNPDIDLPFMINWANENWSRRWDGDDHNILMQQRYSPEDDIAFAQAIEPAVRDSRYIRISGRPVIMLYRPRMLPNPKATIEIWRQYFISRDLGDPYVVMSLNEEDNPELLGIDAAAGFPPHKFGWHLPSTSHKQRLFDEGFGGKVMSYEQMAKCAMEFTPTEFEFFHAVCPDWDNEARKPGRGWSFVGSTPEKYGAWLANACQKAMQKPEPDKRIVFVNAWNEWAEGAYLEPDRYHGYAYLRETARILSRRDFFVGSPVLNYSAKEVSNNRASQFTRVIRRKIAAAAQKLANLIGP